MATRYRFISCHPVSGAMLHPKLDLIDAKWNWVLGGNGQLNAKITIPQEEVPRQAILGATTPWRSAIYVKKQSNNSYPWGGPVVKRTWNRRSGQIDITVAEWRAWMYMIIMDPFTDSEHLYSWVNNDQLIIARSLVQDVTLFGATTGCPTIDYDFSLLSGKYRDLNFYGTQMIRAGNAIDSMANRDGGFEWTLGIKTGSNGLPRLRLDLGYPELGNFIDGLHFKSTPSGSNCDPGDITEDASQQYNRFWTTGSGQPPDQLYAYDFLPDLGGSGLLRLDGNASYPSVVERNTLFSHARRARKFYSDGTQTVPVEHNWGQIDPDSYAVGDRGRLQIKDRLTDIDLSAARIVSKEVSNSGAGSVKVIMDLTDYTLPEVDAGGVV